MQEKGCRDVGMHVDGEFWTCLAWGVTNIHNHLQSQNPHLCMSFYYPWHCQTAQWHLCITSSWPSHHAPASQIFPLDSWTSDRPPTGTTSTAHTILSPDGCYTYDSDGFIHHNGCIYFPSHGNLWLRVLQYKHNHLISGYLGIAKTTKVVLIKYYWPGIFAFVMTITSQTSETLIFGHLTLSYHLKFSEIPVTYILHTSFISSLIIMIPHMSYDLILSS